jgi:drug/metabolite transporter (DMT)-like permease
MNDLRRPTGFLFALLGVILLAYALANPAARAPMDANINVNLWCGLALLVFGGCLLWLSYRTRS